MKTEMIDINRLAYLHEVCLQAEAWPIRSRPKDNEELEGFISDALNLSDYYLQYQSKKNPLYLMKAFCYAIDSKFKIPAWVQAEIYCIFEEYQLSNGDKNLDDLFKTKGQGLGGSPFKRLLVEESHRTLAYHVATLRSIGFTLRVACSLVAYKSHDLVSVNLSECWIEEVYEHFRAIEGEKDWFGHLWQNEITDPVLVDNYLIENGFWIGIDDEASPLNKDPKLRKSYDKRISKIIEARSNSLKNEEFRGVE